MPEPSEAPRADLAGGGAPQKKSRVGSFFFGVFSGCLIGLTTRDVEPLSDAELEQHAATADAAAPAETSEEHSEPAADESVEGDNAVAPPTAPES
ncbi:MAG TPA: hypothetical protein VJ032_01615 [Thermoanaerobaculia bacterium]|nr:hypothetical protein [Thermoanaerobaculia bacterium]